MTATVPGIETPTAYELDALLGDLRLIHHADGRWEIGPVDEGDEEAQEVVDYIESVLANAPTAKAWLRELVDRGPRDRHGTRWIDLRAYQDTIYTAITDGDLAGFPVFGAGPATEHDDAGADDDEVAEQLFEVVVGTLVVAEAEAMKVLKASTAPMTHRSLNGVVDRVLGAAPGDELGMLRWATRIFARHVWIGDLARDAADTLVERLAGKLHARGWAHLDRHSGHERMNAALADTYASMLTAAYDVVRAHLDNEWRAQAKALLHDHLDDVLARFPRLLLAEQWAHGHQSWELWRAGHYHEALTIT